MSMNNHILGAPPAPHLAPEIRDPWDWVTGEKIQALLWKQTASFWNLRSFPNTESEEGKGAQGLPPGQRPYQDHHPLCQ